MPGLCAALSRVRLFATPWTVAHQAPLSMRFSRQEYWSGSPFPTPGDLPDPGIEPRSPALQADALSSEPPGKPLESPAPQVDSLPLSHPGSLTHPKCLQHVTLWITPPPWLPSSYALSWGSSQSFSASHFLISAEIPHNPQLPLSP